MKKTGLISAFLAVMLPAMVVAGCGPRAEKEDPAVKEILALSSVKELGLVEFRVRKIVKADDVGEWYKLGKRKILFSCTAYLKAGIDLSGFSVSDVDMDREAGSVTIRIPHAKPSPPRSGTSCSARAKSRSGKAYRPSASWGRPKKTPPCSLNPCSRRWASKPST